MSLVRTLCFGMLTAIALAAPVTAQQWQHYGGDAGGQKFSPLRPDQHGQRRASWPSPGSTAPGSWSGIPPLHTALSKVQVNPILLPAAAGGHLMICTPFGRVVALDPARGTERWVFDPGARIGGYATPADPEGLASPGFANCRGVAWWEDRQAPAGRALQAPDLPRHPRPAPGGAGRALRQALPGLRHRRQRERRARGAERAAAGSEGRSEVQRPARGGQRRGRARHDRSGTSTGPTRRTARSAPSTPAPARAAGPSTRCRAPRRIRPTPAGRRRPRATPAPATSGAS